MTAPSSTSSEVTVLRTYEQFAAIGAEWQDLFAAAERPTPYQRHGWLKLCWNTVWRHPLNRLRVVLLRENGRLVLAGAFVLGWRKLRPIVYLLGSLTPQYDDVLWRPGAGTSSHTLQLLAALRGELSFPRQLKLDQVLDDSPLVAHARTRPDTRFAPSNTASRIPLHQFGSFDAYFETLSKTLRGDHRRRLRTIMALPDAKFDIRGGDDRAEVVAWTLDRKRAWLGETGREAEWLKGGRIDAVFRALLAEPDVPDVWVSSIRAEGKIIAAAICLVDGDTVYYSKITHDPAYGKQSPARTLTLEIVREAMHSGFRWFDLGQGSSEWKRRFSPLKAGVARARIHLA